MTSKKLILTAVIFFIGITVGIIVSDLEVVEKNFKTSTVNLFHEAELENAPIYEDNIVDLIKNSTRCNTKVFCINELDEKRGMIIRHIWNSDVIPTTHLPDSVERNFDDSRFYGFSNLSHIDKITIEMKHGVNSIAYHFVPIDHNNKIIIYNHGHDGGFVVGKKTIQFFLEEGYSVLALSMPLIGMNDQPIVDTNFGKIKLLSHKYFELIENDNFSPMIYFFEPINVSLNYLQKQYNYEEYDAVGISGGGWTVSIYSALDDRLTKTISVAGTVPFFMRSLEKNIGDYEQISNEFYTKANYMEFYIMSALGKDRKYVQIFNKYDPCCFSGDNFSIYGKIIKDKIKEMGEGYFHIYLDENTIFHEISDYSLEKIIFEIEN